MNTTPATTEQDQLMSIVATLNGAQPGLTVMNVLTLANAVQTWLAAGQPVRSLFAA